MVGHSSFSTTVADAEVVLDDQQIEFTQDGQVAPEDNGFTDTEAARFSTLQLGAFRCLRTFFLMVNKAAKRFEDFVVLCSAFCMGGGGRKCIPFFYRFLLQGCLDARIE